MSIGAGVVPFFISDNFFYDGLGLRPVFLAISVGGWFSVELR